MGKSVKYGKQGDDIGRLLEHYTRLIPPSQNCTMSTTAIETETEAVLKAIPSKTWIALPIEGEIPGPYKTPKFGFQVKPLHPTFACELQGVDWSRPIPREEYQEIRDLVDKVWLPPVR